MILSEEAFDLLDAILGMGAVHRSFAVSPKELRAALDIADRKEFDEQMRELGAANLVVRLNPKSVEDSVRYYVNVARVAEYTGVDESAVLEDAGQSGGMVPASDRIVAIDHNDPRLETAISNGAKLAADLRLSNDLGALAPDAAEVAATEVEALVSSLQRTQVRSESLKAHAISTLSWIRREAAGALVGSAALALLALIAAIFGFVL